MEASFWVRLSMMSWDIWCSYLFAARCTQVPGAFVLLALDEPEAEVLKVALREFVEGQGVGCAGDGGFGHWPLAVSRNLPETGCDT